jgi:hypothetical protein
MVTDPKNNEIKDNELKDVELEDVSGGCGDEGRGERMLADDSVTDVSN